MGEARRQAATSFSSTHVESSATVSGDIEQPVEEPDLLSHVQCSCNTRVASKFQRFGKQSHVVTSIKAQSATCSSFSCRPSLCHSRISDLAAFRLFAPDSAWTWNVENDVTLRHLVTRRCPSCFVLARRGFFVYLQARIKCTLFPANFPDTAHQSTKESDQISIQTQVILHFPPTQPTSHYNQHVFQRQHINSPVLRGQRNRRSPIRHCQLDRQCRRPSQCQPAQSASGCRERSLPLVC